MPFHVGQKVVCALEGVTPGDTDNYGRPGRIATGEIYTISKTGFFAEWNLPVVWLVEVECASPAGWPAEYFRPIVERKTDISFAHDILRKLNGKVDA